LRAACGVSREGSKPTDLVRAAKSYGLDATIVRRQPNDLLRGPVPVIVEWNASQFLVVEGLLGGKVYVNDPGTGHERYRLTSSPRASTAFPWRSRRVQALLRGERSPA